VWGAKITFGKGFSTRLSTWLVGLFEVCAILYAEEEIRQLRTANSTRRRKESLRFAVRQPIEAYIKNQETEDRKFNQRKLFD
jgi:hypothetical protein